MQLDLFCRQEDKWSEIPYVQAVFALRDNPDLHKTCKVDPALLAVIFCPPPKKNPPSKEEVPPKETTPERDPLKKTPLEDSTPISGTKPLYPSLLTTLPSCPSYPEFPDKRTHKHRPNFLPLQEMPSEFSLTRVQVPFSLQDLNLIKGDIGNFSDGPDKYINAFQNLTQVFELSWKNIMLLLTQT